MSITFAADDAPRAEDTVYECMCYNEETKSGHAGCFECKGTGECRFENYEYTTNFSNLKARRYMDLLGSGEEDYSGYCHPVDVKDKLRILVAAKHICAEHNTGGMWRGTHSRLDALIEIFKWAYENDKGVAWG